MLWISFVDIDKAKSLTKSNQTGWRFKKLVPVRFHQELIDFFQVLTCGYGNISILCKEVRRKSSSGRRGKVSGVRGFGGGGGVIIRRSISGVI